MTPEDMIRALQENTLEMRSLKLEIVALRTLLSSVSNQPIAVSPTLGGESVTGPTPGQTVDQIMDLLGNVGIRFEPKKQNPPRRPRQ